MKNSSWLGGTIIGVGVATSVTGHHSPIPFDTNEIVMIDGEVLEFDWRNPHTHLILLGTDAAGQPVEWEVEAQGPSFLTARGITADSIRPGDEITLWVNPNRNPRSHLVNALAVRLADGEEIAVASIVPSELAGFTNLDQDTRESATGISGVWVTQNGHLSWLAGGEFIAQRTLLTSKGLAAVENYDGTQNPQANCVGVVPPRLMLLPLAHTIELGASITTIKSDWINAVRLIYMEGSDAPSTVGETLYGHAVGRWEDETLVVETTNFEANDAGIALGLPSGSQKHLIERFMLDDGGTRLRYEYEITDPEYLEEPVKGFAYLTYRPDAQPTGIECDAESASRYLSEE